MKNRINRWFKFICTEKNVRQNRFEKKNKKASGKLGGLDLRQYDNRT